MHIIVPTKILTIILLRVVVFNYVHIVLSTVYFIQFSCLFSLLKILVNIINHEFKTKQRDTSNPKAASILEFPHEASRQFATSQKDFLTFTSLPNIFSDLIPRDNHLSPFINRNAITSCEFELALK